MRGLCASLRPCALLLLVALHLASAAPPSYTNNNAYEFNAVAVTGGGYVTGFIAHPTEENLMYLRSDIGSSYRWNQTLNKWIPLTDFISEADSNLLGTESFALDPTDPNRLYLAQGRYTDSPAAFFVSEDQGRTFSIYDSPFPMGSNDLGRNNGERLAVNPFKTNELWMGTRTEGLWKSEDYAKTWKNVTSFPNAYANGIGISCVIFDSKTKGTMYAGATAPQGIYQSTDSGATWTQVAGQPSNWDNVYVYPNQTAPQSTAPQPMKAALASNGVLYITYADFPGPYGVDYGVVYSYNTKTHAWKDITPNKTNSYPVPYEPQSFPAGGFCGLSVDVHDPNTLVVNSMDRDPGPAIDSMYISRDGGESWKDVSQLSTPDPTAAGGFWGHPIAQAALDNGTAVPWLNFDWSELWGGYGAPNPVHGLTKFGWWMAAVLISPWDANKVMYATGATIWASDDVLSAAEKNSAPTWYVQAQGVEETVCLAMISPTKGANLLSGFGDINGFRHEDLDVPQPMFSLPVFSNLNSLDWAGQNPDTILRVGLNGLENTAKTGCHQGAYSTNAGVNWTTFPTCIAGVNSSTDDSGTIAIDASGKYIIWTSTSTALEGDNPISNISGPYFSSNLGKKWSSPTGLQIQTPNISADRVQPKTFYSFTNGYWYKSTDGGASYTSKPASAIGLPASTGTGAVPVVNFLKAGQIYLPLGAEGIYYSSNFGESWSEITAGGVNPSLFTVGAAKPGSGYPALFLWGQVKKGGVVGLFRSDDNGASWTRVNDEAHQYGGPSLIQGDARVYGRVYIGTFGRGIVRAELDKNAPGGVNVPGTGGI